MRSKASKRKKHLLRFLFLLSIPLVIFFCYQAWSRNQIISLENIENAAISLNGKILNENSVVTVHVNLDRFYDYEGYFIDCTLDAEVAQIELHQKFSFIHPAKELFLDVPLIGLGDYEKISEVQLVNLFKKETKTIYQK